MSVFSCKDTARLASESLDRDLTLGQRLAVRFHVLLCPPCARFRQHLDFLRDAARRLTVGLPGEDLEQATLSPEARARMQQALEQSNQGKES
jgi:hypothetical protein